MTPGFTDFYGKLSLAFSSMARHGLFARENYWCCQPCALAALDQDASSKEGGYVYYHKQDGERLASGEDFHIRYGSLHEKYYTNQEIGQTVYLELLAAGLDVAWSGSEDQCIIVRQPKEGDL